MTVDNLGLFSCLLVSIAGKSSSSPYSRVRHFYQFTALYGKLPFYSFFMGKSKKKKLVWVVSPTQYSAMMIGHVQCGGCHLYFNIKFNMKSTTDVIIKLTSLSHNKLLLDYPTNSII